MTKAEQTRVSSGGTSLPAEPRVVVVVLNWNGCEDTLDCMRSIRSIAYGNSDVIVVDNGSTDGSVAAIRLLR
jgi:GT2 family glycosyltransferase